MNVLITGSDGFIGKNLTFKLLELGVKVLKFNRNNNIDDLMELVKNADFIMHLAGENRPKDNKEFIKSNINLTHEVCRCVSHFEKKIPIAFASSIQADDDSPYGNSKKQAEEVLKSFGLKNKSKVYIYRLPGVFGKWCKPNYNSVVATFCYNTVNGHPLNIHSPYKKVQLIYIDDLITNFVNLISDTKSNHDLIISPQYAISIKELATKISRFKSSRDDLFVDDLGEGLTKKLYSTYISYFKPNDFSYSYSRFEDSRGIFSEIVKSSKSGQLSYFSINPGEIRGNHYHHTKTEKFYVIDGSVVFKYMNILSGENYEVTIHANDCRAIESIPGWAHSLINNTHEKAIVILWSNEIFDKVKPDTFNFKI